MEAVNKLSEKIFQYLEKGEAFLAEQLPEFASQLIEYAAWEAYFSYEIAFWFCLLFFIIALISLVMTLVRGESGAFAVLIISGFVFIVSLIMTVSTYKDVKMFEKAPKLYLIKTVKNVFEGEKCNK
jgi:fucose 4-O-acetylase-like acetyltransferase